MFTLDSVIIIFLGAVGLILFHGFVYWGSRHHGPSVSKGNSQMDLTGLSNGLREELRELQRGRKIEAVKRLRDSKGWGLKRAKEAVEALNAGQEYEQYQNLRAQIHQNYPSPELAREVERLLAKGKKIEAIHHVRQRTSWDLKWSKEYVEQLNIEVKPS